MNEETKNKLSRAQRLAWRARKAKHETAPTKEYYCKHCGKTVQREADKQWITSYCEKISKDTRLTLNQ